MAHKDQCGWRIQSDRWQSLACALIPVVGPFRFSCAMLCRTSTTEVRSVYVAHTEASFHLLAKPCMHMHMCMYTYAVMDCTRDGLHTGGDSLFASQRMDQKVVVVYGV